MIYIISFLISLTSYGMDQQQLIQPRANSCLTVNYNKVVSQLNKKFCSSCPVLSLKQTKNPNHLMQQAVIKKMIADNIENLKRKKKEYALTEILLLAALDQVVKIYNKDNREHIGKTDAITTMLTSIDEWRIEHNEFVITTERQRVYQILRKKRGC